MKTNKVSKIDKFFRLLLIKTYKSFFHLLGMAIFVSQILLFGGKEILSLDKNMLPIQITFLALNFFTVNYLLEKLGINKLMADEYQKLTK